MANTLFSPAPLWQTSGLALLRIITGLLMAYHGFEILTGKNVALYGVGCGKSFACT